MTIRLSSADLAAVSALMPSVEELADRVRAVDGDLTDAEALEVGDQVRRIMVEVLEQELCVDGNGGDDAR